jgi:hypothetical protein
MTNHPKPFKTVGLARIRPGLSFGARPCTGRASKRARHIQEAVEEWESGRNQPPAFLKLALERLAQKLAKAA